MRGELILYTKDGVVHLRSLYNCKYDRKKIIWHWLKLYGRKFWDCTLAIIPDAEPDNIDERGMNCRKDHPFIFGTFDSQ